MIYESNAKVDLSAAPNPDGDGSWYFVFRVNNETVVDGFALSIDNALAALRNAYLAWREEHIIPNCDPDQKPDQN